MRISNPKTTAGGLPLATTWYVNTRFKNTKDYIDAVSGQLHDYTQRLVTDEASGRMDADDTLSTAMRNEFISTSAYIDTQDQHYDSLQDQHNAEIISAFCKYMTGYGAPISEYVSKYIPTLSSLDPSEYYAPKANGYAWLLENKKIDPALIPDIAIMDINVIDVKDIFNYLNGGNTASINYFEHEYVPTQVSEESFYNRIIADPNKLEVILGVVKDCIQLYVLKNQSREGDIKSMSTGDVTVITWFGFDDIKDELEKSSLEFLKNVFSQTYMAGAWICNAQTRKVDGLNSSISYVKISYNQGQILSINNIVPGNDGDVKVRFADMYRVRGAAAGKINDTLAANIQRIASTEDDQCAMSGLVTTGGLTTLLNLVNRFVFDNNAGQCHAYTTIDEFNTLNKAAETVRADLSAAIDAQTARAEAAEAAETLRATTDQQIISGALDAEVTRAEAAQQVLTDKVDYLSGVIGTEADLTGVTVTSALLALKSHTSTVRTDLSAIVDLIDSDRTAQQYDIDPSADHTGYDIIKEYTVVIPAGKVSEYSAVNTNGSDLGINAKKYTEAHTLDLNNAIYQNDIYNYFGLIRPADDDLSSNGSRHDIAEITISNIPGKVIDVYAVNGDTCEKIDVQIEYKVRQNATSSDIHEYVSNVKLLSQYNAGKDGTQYLPSEAAHEKLVIHYTCKFTAEVSSINPLFK